MKNRKQAGLCEGVIQFMKAFLTDDEAEHLQETSEFVGLTNTVSTTMFTISVKEIEPDMFLCLILSHENLYADSPEKHEKITISNFAHTFSLFREEDTHIFTELLTLYHDLFRLFHNTMTDFFLNSPEQFKKMLNDFTINFDRYYFHSDWGRTYFNNWVFRGYGICPLDSKMYLYSIKHVNAIKTQFDSIRHIWVFYKDYYLYSDLPQESVEVLHTYLIGAANEKRDGYIPNWMDEDTNDQHL